MTAPRPTTGATASGAEKRKIWPWLLLAAVVAALLLWWLIAALADDDDVVDIDSDGGSAIEQTTESETETDTETDTETETEGDATTSPGATGAPGSLLIGDLDALRPGADLDAEVGQPVTANSVEVQAVVADEAFYVGPEDGQTILVRLQAFGGTDDPESPFEIEEGDTVSFIGTLQEVDEAFIADLQLYDAAEQLETGQFYVQASEINATG